MALLLGASLLAWVSVPAALLADALLIGLAVVDRKRAGRVSASRSVPASGALNGTVAVEIEIRSDVPVTLRVTDDPGPGLTRLPPDDPAVRDASGPEGASLRMAAGELARVGYRLALGKRGDLHVGPIHVRTLGPWGMAWRQDHVEVADRIRVQPGSEDLRRERVPGLRPELAAPGLRRLRRYGEGSEFESLRAYQPGDDPRTVDWKASARRSDLLVRNFQVERNQTVVIAIDAGRLMREWIDDRERLDHALSAALLVAERARSYQDRVGLIVFDEVVRMIVPPGRVKLAAMADTLAGVESRLVEPNYPAAFATLKRTFKKRSLIMVFSDVVDSSASSPLLQGIVGTAGHHLPVAVALRNPDIDRAAVERGATEGAAFRRAAAETLLEARARALQTMRRAGVHVVDIPPGGATGAVLAKYAEIKARGLL